MPAKFRAFVQLLRLPNVFTAVADPLAGWFLIGGGEPAWHIVLLVATSACLYTAGIVLNDCFDYRLDCRERPERPLPSGAVSRRTTWVLGTVLMLTGLACAAVVSLPVFALAGFIAAMILFYNAWAKRFAVLGPLALGTCRFANFLLGMRCLPAHLWYAPVILGVYVAVLTYIARSEVINPSVRLTVKRLLLGIIVLDAILANDPVGSVLILSLLIPATVLGKLIQMT
ncbi:MAG: Protoheme IX farnesyltransferase [Verrucomicrobiae bacterium]|nr:Protoheme IX farnesyltransferase [Verrucomicrobiae bacterium]